MPLPSNSYFIFTCLKHFFDNRVSCISVLYLLYTYSVHCPKNYLNLRIKSESVTAGTDAMVYCRPGFWVCTSTTSTVYLWLINQKIVASAPD